MPQPFLPLKVQSDIEQQKGWEGISTPNELAQYLSRVLAVDPNVLLNLQEVTYSSTEPTGTDRNKIWIRTTDPVGIGIPVGGVYQVITKYPINVAFLLVGHHDEIPSYMRKLSADELEAYHLTAPGVKLANWVIIEQ